MEEKYFDQFDEIFFDKLSTEEKTGGEKFFEDLDKILTFSFKENNDKRIWIEPKTEDITCGGIFDDEKEISAKSAFELISTEQCNLKMCESLFNRKNCIQAVWIFKDKIGKPYYRHWKEIINVFRNAAEPIVYDREKMLPDKNGDFENQEWAYMVANGILGLENHDEELKEIFGCKYNFAEKISYLKKRQF